MVRAVIAFLCLIVCALSVTKARADDCGSMYKIGMTRSALDAVTARYLKCARAYVAKGNIYLNDKNYDAAVREYTNAIQADPNYTNAYFNRALAYSDEQKFALAIPDFDVVISRNPSDADAISRRMVAHMALEQHAQGNADAARLQALNPNVPPRNCHYVGNAYMDCARADGSTYSYRLNVPYYPTGSYACFQNMAGTFICQHHDYP